MPVIKLRGLPWSCTHEDIARFLQGAKIMKAPTNGAIKKEDSGEESPDFLIHMMTNADGRPSGEAFVELEDEADLEVAMKKNNGLMGQRYIEVFRSNYDQLNKHLEESVSNTTNWSDPVVRLRGLPYGCVKADIATFFEGLKLASDCGGGSSGSGGIMMVIDFTGRFNGEAFVQFESLAEAHKALERHKQKISNRYIEVFRSTFDEMDYYANNASMNRGNGGGGDNGGGGGYGSNGGARSARSRGGGVMKTFSSASNSRSSSANGFSNQRTKPYSRNGPGMGMGSRRGGGGDSFRHPMPLMSFNNRNGAGGYGNSDDYGDEYDDENGGGYNNGSYVCENNHRHYLGMGKNGGGGNGYGSGDDNYDRTGFGLKMRGLPYSADEEEIRKFFRPHNPTNVVLLYGNDGRPTGECEVDFMTYDELTEAMKYDKKYIGNRYIELFLLPGNAGGGRHGSDKPISLGSLMNKNFSGSSGGRPGNNNNNNPNNSNNLNSLFTNFESYGSPMQMPLPSLLGSSQGPAPVPAPLMPSPAMTHDLVDSVTSYSSNLNEFLMADMAQKMFASAFGRFQQPSMRQSSGGGGGGGAGAGNGYQRRF